MDDAKTGLLEYLKNQTGGKLLMSPKQLAQEIPFSVKQQSELRIKGKFHIRSQQMGGKVFYSIFDVADYILTGKITADIGKPKPVIEPALPIVQPEVSKPRRRGRKPVEIEDISHRFNLRSFVAHVQDKAEKLMAFSTLMTKYEQSFLLKEKLEAELPPLPDDDEDDMPVKNAI